MTVTVHTPQAYFTRVANFTRAANITCAAYFTPAEPSGSAGTSLKKPPPGGFSAFGGWFVFFACLQEIFVVDGA